MRAAPSRRLACLNPVLTQPIQERGFIERVEVEAEMINVYALSTRCRSAKLRPDWHKINQM